MQQPNRRGRSPEHPEQPPGEGLVHALSRVGDLTERRAEQGTGGTHLVAAHLVAFRRTGSCRH
jgi:hypothetical protein